jgi:hypothetical protein
MVSRLAVFAGVTVVVAATAAPGLWFVPFVAGVAAGLLSLRRPGVVPAATLGAITGWALPLWILALRGLPAGATARAIAALAGIPPYAAVAIVATLLLAALQTLAGAWLARALTRVFAPMPQTATPEPAAPAEQTGATRRRPPPPPPARAWPPGRPR